MHTYLLKSIVIIVFISVAYGLETPHNNLNLSGNGTLQSWKVIGPFDNPVHPEKSWVRLGHDIDYLESIGGSAQFRGAKLDELKLSTLKYKYLIMTSILSLTPACLISFKHPLLVNTVSPMRIAPSTWKKIKTSMAHLALMTK